MSLADIVAPNLPFLRRYARALAGSQGGGDAYVEAVLEAVVADPALIRSGVTNAKVALYRLLCRLWESVSINRRPESGTTWERAAQAHLTQIAPRPRQAFLLTTVENFSIDEAAAILDVDRDDVLKLVAEASREIAEMIATDVLIIEDEPLIAMDLQDIVNGLGHHVSGVARTRAEAVHMALQSQPGIILADIHLADGSSGLDAVNDLLGEFEVPVVFITAFPERLLTGNRPEPAFLITKPFAPDTVKAMIGQALFFDRKAHRPEAERALQS
jgi:DNA-directed RNA polymerase specialized sigma24 family protein